MLFMWMLLNFIVDNFANELTINQSNERYFEFYCFFLRAEKIKNTGMISKHMVYIGMDVENIGNFILNVGTIIKDNFIITNLALNNYEFQNIATNMVHEVINVRGFVVAGNSTFTKTPEKINMYYISNVKSIHRFEYNEDFLIDKIQFFNTHRIFPQITIVKLKTHLPVNGITIDVLNLPLNYEPDSTDCLVGGWGNLNITQYETKSRTFFETKVTVLSKNICESAINEYKTTLCIVPKNGKNQCDLFNGGEPLICSGLIIGVVSAMYPCNKEKPRPCADLVKHIKWIDFHMYDTYVYRKSSQIQLKPISHIFIYISCIIIERFSAY